LEDRQQLTRRRRRAPRRPALALLPVFAAALSAPAQAAEPLPQALPIPGAGVPAEAAPSAAVPTPADAATPAAVDRNQVHREAVEVFEQLDVDHDGRLQPVETMSLASEAFEAADRDHDGALSIVEWVDARFAEVEAAAAPPAGAPAPSASPGGEGPPAPAR